MIDFKLFGVPIRVEPSFWLILGLLGFLMFGINTTHGILAIGLLVVAGFLSILIHELGHALMIKKYGLPTQIVLASFGGYATHPAGILDRKQDFLVTLAGPLVQFALGALLYLTVPFPGIPADNMLNTFFNIFISVSIIWAVFNCFPVLPLDGGRMLNALLGPRRQKTTIMVSMVTALLLALAGFLYGEIFIAIFMGMFFYQNLQAFKQLP